MECHKNIPRVTVHHLSPSPLFTGLDAECDEGLEPGVSAVLAQIMKENAKICKSCKKKFDNYMVK